MLGNNFIGLIFYRSFCIYLENSGICDLLMNINELVLLLYVTSQVLKYLIFFEAFHFIKYC